MSYIFDYESLEKQLNLPEETVKRIRKVVRKEFPEDDMMYELHLVRIYNSLKNRRITIEDILLISV